MRANLLQPNTALLNPYTSKQTTYLKPIHETIITNSSHYCQKRKKIPLHLALFTIETVISRYKPVQYLARKAFMQNVCTSHLTCRVTLLLGTSIVMWLTWCWSLHAVWMCFSVCLCYMCLCRYVCVTALCDSDCVLTSSKRADWIRLPIITHILFEFLQRTERFTCHFLSVDTPHVKASTRAANNDCFQEHKRS